MKEYKYKSKQFIGSFSTFDANNNQDAIDQMYRIAGINWRQHYNLYDNNGKLIN